VKTWLAAITGMSSLAFVASVTNAEPREYTIDNEHTHIVWAVDRFGFTKTIGTFSDVAGELVWDAEQPANSRATASIALSGLRSDLAQREEIVRGPYWLDAEKSPVIEFESVSLIPTDSENCNVLCAEVRGTLTLKGTSAPVDFLVALNQSGDDPVSGRSALGFSGTGSFSRSEFGITTALGPIGDEVTFRIEVLAIATDPN
jgi:polyisoprenoid-binding protein YceI